MRGKRILIKPVDDYKGDINIMAIIHKVGSLHEKGGFVEYKMSETMAKDLLAQRKGDELKMRPVEYLCKIVNERFGLKGVCNNVIID